MIFAPDGKTLAAYSFRHLLSLGDVATGRCVSQLVLTEELVQSGTFSPDGRSLALDSGDGTVTLVEVATGQVRRTWGLKIALAEDARLPRYGTPQARQVLQTLAGGAPGALLTTTAQAALKR